MRKSSLLSAIAFTVFASNVNAADLPVKAAPMAPPPPAFSWTGIYIGGHLGGGWGQKTWSQPSGSGDTTGLVDAEGTTSGILGGGQIGLNYQFSPRWVAGIEADFSWGNIKGSFPCFDGFHQIIGEASADHCGAKSDSIVTVVGRVGPTVGPMWIYLLGGGAWVRDHYTDSYFFPDHYGSFVVGYSASETRSGWTVGGGVEYAVDANWSAKIQYNYMDFGTRRVTISAPGGDPAGDCPCQYDENIEQKIHTVKFGLNYRFNWAHY
jgi:outer membrane immunogenic protein